jgi:periplasmic mercuric ion binding protein
MKSLSIILFCISITSALAEEKTVTIEVNTMVCGADPHNINQSLTTLLGVKSVLMSLPEKTATIVFDDEKSDTEKMLIAIAAAGYAGLVKAH